MPFARQHKYIGIVLTACAHQLCFPCLLDTATNTHKTSLVSLSTSSSSSSSSSQLCGCPGCCVPVALADIELVCGRSVADTAAFLQRESDRLGAGIGCMVTCLKCSTRYEVDPDSPLARVAADATHRRMQRQNRSSHHTHHLEDDDDDNELDEDDDEDDEEDEVITSNSTSKSRYAGTAFTCTVCKAITCLRCEVVHGDVCGTSMTTIDGMANCAQFRAHRSLRRYLKRAVHDNIKAMLTQAQKAMVARSMAMAQADAQSRSFTGPTTRSSSSKTSSSPPNLCSVSVDPLALPDEFHAFLDGLNKAYNRAIKVGIPANNVNFEAASAYVKRNCIPVLEAAFDHPFRRRWQHAWSADKHLDNEVTLHPIASDSIEWQLVVSRIATGHRVKIHSIQRIQAPKLWNKYLKYCKRTFGQQGNKQAPSQFIPPLTNHLTPTNGVMIQPAAKLRYDRRKRKSVVTSSTSSSSPSSSSRLLQKQYLGFGLSQSGGVSWFGGTAYEGFFWHGTRACFPESDTRILTNEGFMFLAEIQERNKSRSNSLLYACYDKKSKTLVYRKGQTVILTPDEAKKKRIINMTETSESLRWMPGSGDYGQDLPSPFNVLEDYCGSSATDLILNYLGFGASNHLSLRVTDDHMMFVQMGNKSTHNHTIHWQHIDHNGSRELKPPSKTIAKNLLPRGIFDSRNARFLASAEGGANGTLANDNSTILPFVQVLNLDSEEKVNAFLEFYGFWLGDGYLDGKNRKCYYVSFHLRKSSDIEWVERQMTLCSLESTEWVRRPCSDDGTVTFSISSDKWCQYFSEEYGVKYGIFGENDDADMSVSSDSLGPTIASAKSSGKCQRDAINTDLQIESAKWLWKWALQHLSRDQSRLLIRGLHRADGDCTHQAMYTSSTRFRDEIAHLLFNAGYATYFCHVPAGTLKGYYKYENHKSKFISTHDYQLLPVVEKKQCKEMRCNHDQWCVNYTNPTTDADKGSSFPHISLKDCVTQSAYDERQDGRLWCVDVEHEDHLIVAQRAYKNAKGAITKASKPIIVGNCHPRVIYEGIGFDKHHAAVGGCIWFAEASTYSMGGFQHALPSKRNVVLLALVACGSSSDVKQLGATPNNILNVFENDATYPAYLVEYS